MLDYIKGYVEELTPTYVILENNGLGYFLNVSLNTSEKLKKNTDCQLFVHEVIREDAHIMYGFHNKQEREIFRLLISVNGVGPNTARLIISSITYQNLIAAISSNNIDLIKSVKGIGVKTAQRIIIDLKDKISAGTEDVGQILNVQDNTLANDSLSALIMLGFSKPQVQKVVKKILDDNKNKEILTVETVIKKALNYL